MTVDIPYELPENWVWTSLADIADIIMGSSPPSSSYNKEKAGLPFYQGKTDFGFLSPTPRVWCSSPYKVAEEGDVLISVRAPVGPTNLCTEKSCIGRGLGAIRPRAGIPSLFVLFYLRSIEKNVAQMGTGSTFTAIKRSDLESLPFPLASLNEQKRIVAKIESLFAESKTTLDALGKLPVFLRRFRQSVLAKAFRGELTQRESDDEPAQKLLAKIELERQKRGEQNRFAESLSNDIEEMPELPYGWKWTKLGQVCHVNKDHIDPCEKPEATFNYLSIENIESESGKLVSFSPTLGKNIRSSKLVFTTNDILYSKLRPYLNKVHIPNFSGISATDLIPLRPEGGFPREYLAYYLRTQTIVEYANQRTRGIQLPRLPVKDLLGLPVPLAPLEEAKRVVTRIENLFALADDIESSVKIARERADRIDQAILAKAFRGELVPQDPNDEPASILLKQIKDTTKLKMETKKKKTITDYQSELQTERRKITSLEEILREIGPATIEQAFEASGLSMNEFWDTLKIETEGGRIEKLRKGNIVVLRVKK